MSNKLNNVEDLITDHSISYTGMVTTEKVFKNKVVETMTSHNEGNSLLFRLIANSIAGTYDLDIIPRYICGFSDASLDKTKATFSNYIPYSSKKVQSSSSGDGSYQIVYSFLVPYSQINTAKDTKYYGLYSDASGQNLLAHIELSSSYRGDGMTNRVITWTMSIGNPSSN